jgi:beta-lactamase superfamily II metal-dependent hydrolase
MYRIGFGDCFLLSLPAGGSLAHVLIDCGVHSRGDIGTMQQIVDDIAQQTDKRLALVVATHRHQDHISGFGRYEREFKQFKVGEVWLPWTEDPKDLHAKQLKDNHSVLARNLQPHLQATGARLDDSLEGRALFAVLKATGNDEALRVLASGINGATVRYLGAGRTLKDALGIQGLHVQVLGPPRDRKFLSKMDPPSGDRFFRLNGSGKSEVVHPIVPFENKWTVGAEAYPTLSDREQLKKLIDTFTALAFALDQVLNNTSLVTLFSYRGKNLLFPGDAQYGNWQSWLDTPGAQAVLEHVDFFKIAHHGSHNATPKSALERMRKGFAAMISTQNQPWASIPFEKMLNRLEEKASGVVRSDSIKVAGATNAPEGPALQLGAGFSAGPFWCDYTLAL